MIERHLERGARLARNPAAADDGEIILSSVWNGQQKAFMFYMTMLAVLIFVVQPDGDLRKG
ncbi:DUF2165 family protein [Mesorhizobium mediterraneum]|uniref:Uncharacterized protein n=1 Tax=Mesorhizobium mediterraneum TaxID=43617 RepID=A0AB36R9X7_9HYPH|nr:MULTISPECIES: DUF2165 family protein [Mesorhizobium]PAQ01107.1 hypothetical protein CIT25_17380 [Mesorhizobium mediterraneum]WIW52111.1 DUF2165 family protein [Mesorhizobium mediterraneum]